jgi:hypothetical protein
MKKVLLLSLVLFSSCCSPVVAVQPLPTPPVVESPPEPIGLLTAVAYDCHVDSEGNAWSHVVLKNGYSRNVTNAKGFVDFTDSYGTSARGFFDTQDLVIVPESKNSKGPYLTIVSVPFKGRKLSKCTAFLARTVLANNK